VPAVRKSVLNRHRDVVLVVHVHLVEGKLVGTLATGAASADLVVVRHGFERCVSSGVDGFVSRRLGLGGDGGVDGGLK
jgi:hypothetical protein